MRVIFSMKRGGPMIKHYIRWQMAAVQHAIAWRRVILLAGPRQCGKTTLAKALDTTGMIYRTLDDVTFLEAALADPHGFVRHKHTSLMIIDEIQRAPILLQAVKKEVDENEQMGQFLLTGSANILALPNVNESLAGRVRNIRLRPLAQGEIQGTYPNFIPLAFHEKFPTSYIPNDKDAYIKIALDGGYPAPLRMQNSKEARQWHLDYIHALLERDLKDILHIKRQSAMKDLLHTLAAWSSKEMNIVDIGASLSLTKETIVSYINALEALYLVEKVPAWANTDYARVKKKDKLFMTDTGLMAALLNWRYDAIRLDGGQNGKLLETYVFTQLAAHIDALEGNDAQYTLYHYRDREKREIDFIIEKDHTDLLGIEVKAGSTVSRDSFQHLRWFKKNIAKEKHFIGIVLYTGDQIASFGDHMWAIPINVLWAPNQFFQ